MGMKKKKFLGLKSNIYYQIFIILISVLQLSVESRLKLEVAYYNEMLSVWEPLLEPVPDNGKYRRWELQLEVIII